MTKEFLFRFLGEMPRGKVEFTCICGEYNSGLSIPVDKEREEFTCRKCGAKITVWEQPEHWHMTIVLAEEAVET